MATANFGTPNFGLPLMVGGMTGNENTDDMQYEEAENMVKELNDKLRYFEVYTESGYYEGFMFNAKQTDDYWDYRGISDLTDEDAEYFYGDTADNVKADMDEELDKIKQALADWKENGGLELERVAQFSNGETLYKAV